MRTLFKINSPFFIPYLIFIVFGGVLLAIGSKVNIHLTFNSFHHSFFDTFFFYVTYLGDGTVALLVTIMLVAVKYRYALIVGLSNIISAVITQTLKQNVFPDALRPKKYFEGLHELYFVPGVENHLYYSFPSGHTTCAFALFLSLSLIVKNKNLKLLFFFVALLVGYSRIYLSQHFFDDVYVGSIIGVGVTVLVYQAIQKIEKGKLDRSLISSF